MISLLSRNKDCVTEISACEILGTFLRTIKDADFQQQRVLDTLSGLTNAPQLVKEAHAKGKEGCLVEMELKKSNLVRNLISGVELKRKANIEKLFFSRILNSQ